MLERRLGVRHATTLGLLAGAVVLLACVPLRADADADDRLAKVTAAFIYNFTRYTDWPDVAFPKDDDPLVIAVVDTDKVFFTLAALTDGQSVHGRPIRVHWVQPPEPDDDEDETSRRAKWDDFLARLRRSHVVFVGDAYRHVTGRVVLGLRERNVLTVGDGPGFAGAGGMLGLKLLKGRMVFQANVDAIKAAGLIVSSKVLRLAEIVSSRHD